MNANTPLILLAGLLLAVLAACTAADTNTVPAASAPPPANGPSQLPVIGNDPLNPSTQCRTDDDCEIKNVGNCCGYYPACVNTAAAVDPEAVQAQCAESGMAGVCGFPDISACTCVQNRCQAEQTRSLQPD